ncbi:class I SAM-dependent methyltransferase [Candidatus Woesearchaeota archaeon]|nr:class I SAM-dependent methyltransferase [Candidatus Woesearchaeota archaeon]
MEGKKEVKGFLGTRNSIKRKSTFNVVRIDVLKESKLKSGKILDVGCGFGGLIKNINHYRKGFSFVGIDLSKAMIDAARKYCEGIPAIFYVKPADKTGFKTESFDLVICKDTFHHFNRPVKVLTELYRITKKRGFIYITDLDRNTSMDLVYEEMQRLAEKRLLTSMMLYDSIQAAYTVPEMKLLFKKAGFKKYKIYTKKSGKNFVKEYNVPDAGLRNILGFIETRWVAIIRT